jgi:hypothetical protein
MSENPFELLGLPPTAAEDEVVRQGARLCQRAADEPTRNRLRQAVRQLTGPAEERSLHALLAHPRPDYARPAREAFQSAFRRPPAPEAPPPSPPVDADGVRAALCQALAAELEAPPLALELLDEEDGPGEIARQTAEALWQGLAGLAGG